MKYTPQYLIERLKLVRHPDGGFYKQTYRSNETIPISALPNRFTSDHAYCTAILYLLERNEFSAFHRIKQDEIWHFYIGERLLIHIISPEGEYRCCKLGINIESDEIPQVVVKAGNWFAAELIDKGSFALVGCTVAPGFDFEDLEIGRRELLIKQYPQHEEIIDRLTR